MKLTRWITAAALTLMAGFSSVASAQDTIKVLSWNLEHFVDPLDDPYVDNSMEDEANWKGEEALKKLALAIGKIDADVIAFQEVEGDRAVKLFLDSYLPEHEYKFWAGLPSIQWYQNIAIVSKYPIGRITSFREVMMYNEVENESENKYNNRLVAAEIIVNDDYSFQLVNLHLKAGGAEKDVVWRTKQIQVVSDWFQHEAKADPSTNIMVIGDMNMVPTSGEYESLVGNGEYPFFDPSEALDFPPTHPSRKPVKRLDQVFLNKAMEPEYAPNSVSVPQPISIEEMETLSDHLPIAITIYTEDK